MSKARMPEAWRLRNPNGMVRGSAQGGLRMTPTEYLASKPTKCSIRDNATGSYGFRNEVNCRPVAQYATKSRSASTLALLYTKNREMNSSPLLRAKIPSRT